MTLMWRARAYIVRDHTSLDAESIRIEFKITIHCQCHPNNPYVTRIDYKDILENADYIFVCHVYQARLCANTEIIDGVQAAIFTAAESMLSPTMYDPGESLHIDIFVVDEQGDEEAVDEHMEYFPNMPASKEAIRSLRREKARTKEVGGCVICMGDLETGERVARLPCSHFFHDACIVTWLKTQSTCPLCRLPLPVV